MTTATTPTAAPRGAAFIYNSAVASWAICAAWEVGALDELRLAGTVDAIEFAERHDLDPQSVQGMFRALASVDIVRRDGTLATVSTEFDDVYANRSFFYWLSRGSAELFRRMPEALRNKNRVGSYFERDAAAIAFACYEIDEICYAPTFWAAMDRLNFTLGRVADLGCGSGGRLMQVLERFPGAKGIGIDIARPSLEVAKKRLANSGMAERVSFIEADVLELTPQAEFADVELLTCFMMGHDFWPRESCVATLRKLRKAFPAAQRFLLGDATRTAYSSDTELPVFTLGFELGHDLMDAFIPRINDWESVFEEGGWTLLRTNRIEKFVGEVIFELS